MMAVNTLQKSGLVGAILLALIVIFLHNPTGGYSWSIMAPRSTDPFKVAECSNQEYLMLTMKRGDRSNAEQARFIDMNKACDAKIERWDEEVALPFDLWYSKAALVPAFGYVATVAWTLLTIVAAGIVWIVAFRPMKNTLEAPTRQ
jgi:hypothetical protein